MNDHTELSQLELNQQYLGNGKSLALPAIPVFETLEEERLHRKQKLAGAFRLFSRFGFDEGVAVHTMRPDVNAAAHTHSPYGRAWSALGRTLDPITQDVCAFYNDHAVYDDFGGVAVELDEGVRIAKALGQNKAAILQNHGIITAGETVDAAAWWYICLERSCQVQLLAEAASHGKPLKTITPESAQKTYDIVGSPYAGWFQFQPLYARILKEQPDFLD